VKSQLDIKMDHSPSLYSSKERNNKSAMMKSYSTLKSFPEMYGRKVKHLAPLSSNITPKHSDTNSPQTYLLSPHCNQHQLLQLESPHLTFDALNLKASGDNFTSVSNVTEKSKISLKKIKLPLKPINPSLVKNKIFISPQLHPSEKTKKLKRMIIR
jgi:hypothetical protein